VSLRAAPKELRSNLKLSMKMLSLKHQTISGIKWLVGSSFLQKAIQTGATIFLARILGPADFGLFALAFVAIDALGLFKSMGFDSALIQRKDNMEKAANTAFIIIPVLGIILYFILAVFAPLIGKFLNNAQIPGVIRALGIIFIISCFGKVPAALLEKNMQFKRVAIIEIGTAIIYSLSAVTFALLKFGVWSLVYAYILKTIYQNTLTFIYAKWRPKLEFDIKIAKEMFNFGKFLFLGGLVFFLKMNLDNILVGKLLGVTALGLYAIAFNVANFGADYFGAKVFRVVFPAYSKLQNDVYDLKMATLKTLKYVSIISLPLGIGIFFLSKEILNLIYGEKWLAASGVLKILAWAGIFNSLFSAISAIFPSCGKSKLVFWIIALQVGVFLLIVTPLARFFGMNGVGFAVSFTGLVTLIITLYWATKLIYISVNDIYLSLKPAFISSIIMAMIIVFFKFIVKNFLPLVSFYYYVPVVVFSVFIYAAALFFIERPIIQEIRELIIS